MNRSKTLQARTAANRPMGRVTRTSPLNLKLVKKKLVKKKLVTKKPVMATPSPDRLSLSNSPPNSP